MEPAIGKLNFAAIYFTSLLAGSFGALLFQPRRADARRLDGDLRVFGALIVVAHARRIPIWQSGLAPILLLNLVFTLTVSGISIGGHLGGLVAGFITGWLVVEFGGEARPASRWRWSAVSLIALASVFGGDRGRRGHGPDAQRLDYLSGLHAVRPAGRGRRGPTLQLDDQRLRPPRRRNQLRMQDAGEQLETVDDPRPGPREVRRTVDGDDLARANRCSRSRCISASR